MSLTNSMETTTSTEISAATTGDQRAEFAAGAQGFAIIGDVETIRDILCGPQQHNEHCKGWRWHLYMQDAKLAMAAVDAEGKRMIAAIHARREALALMSEAAE